VLAGLGAFSLVLAVIAVLSTVDLGFIDARSMAFISLLMVATGVFMIRGGGR
jgi:hypothetical protein